MSTVLVPQGTRGNVQNYHLPDPDDEGKPLCGCALQDEKSYWNPKDKKIIPHHTLCKSCERRQ